jgi:N-acyl-D-amino-acid deacylase
VGHGLTLAEIARRRDTDAVDAALDLLAASRLEVNAIMAVRDQRPVSDLGRLISHPAHLGGSDGIFIGAHPHPRARGAFASYLGTFVREHGLLDWAEAVRHLSTAPADRFRLGDRGRIRPGSIADIALIDPQVVGDRATYDAPGRLAEGIEDVLVAGRPVLSGGRLTGALPGGGVRATPADARDRSPARSDNPPPRKGDT